MIDLAAELQAWLEPRADGMAALLEELVAVDTENPPGRGLGACGGVLRDAMAQLGLAPELIDSRRPAGWRIPASCAAALARVLG
jgi:succinyl-diaminopimelate desuccinylase